MSNCRNIYSSERDIFARTAIICLDLWRRLRVQPNSIWFFGTFILVFWFFMFFGRKLSAFYLFANGFNYRPNKMIRKIECELLVGFDLYVYTNDFICFEMVTFDYLSEINIDSPLLNKQIICVRNVIRWRKCHTCVCRNNIRNGKNRDLCDRNLY